jgi:hypothetical protein
MIHNHPSEHGMNLTIACLLMEKKREKRFLRLK